MKKTTALILALLLLLGVLPFAAFSAEEAGAPSGFAATPGLYVHAVSDSADTEAWQLWQSVHDEDFNIEKPTEKYFFLPSSADESSVDVYNGYDASVAVNGVEIASKSTASVPYEAGKSYNVTLAPGSYYTLTMMNSTAEAAIYINNPDADGSGTDLMTYLNANKSNSANATGAIVTPDGKIDNTVIKKIKGRGNTSWDKPKKGYNIT